MAAVLSPRLRNIVEALPLAPGLRVIEIGCGPGAAARAVAARIEGGHLLAIDRSARAIAQAMALSAEGMANGRLSFRTQSAEEFALLPDEPRYDLAFAVRVGAFDGRYPEAGKQALARLRAALKPGWRLFVDGGNPLREILLGDGI